MSDHALETAARAAYAETTKRVPNHYSDPDVLAQYKPWDEISEAWREDYTAIIAVAIAAYEDAAGGRRSIGGDVANQRLYFKARIRGRIIFCSPTNGQ